MAVVTIERVEPGSGEQEVACCRALEEGHILFFPRTPFALSEADRAFLLRQRQVDSAYHKNIVYRPETDRVSNFVQQRPGDDEELRRVLRRYSQQAVAFVAALLPRYARRWRVDYASFRPQEEAGRRLPTRARNDLLHVDAFPTRPTRGDRILRIFTNVNPTAPRVWVTGETFEELAERFAIPSGLLARARRAGGVLGGLRRAARALGLPVAARSPYDEFMLRFHHFLKENGDYQAAARKLTTAFPPGSTWMVFTDMVSHSVLSGQYALEQTFIVPREALLLPEKAPVAILERLTGARLA
ncbi:MAG TPA: Kdo hydroxylase family protein [Thermodesulfobacteriota bacterium]|nr:Kdo hydroxylase family protein [Thermodesulfobacteriota bacterium]